MKKKTYYYVIRHQSVTYAGDRLFENFINIFFFKYFTYTDEYFFCDKNRTRRGEIKKSVVVY